MAREMKDSGIDGVGNIPVEWKVCRFKNVCEINTEFVDPRTGEYDDLPHIGPGNIEKFTGRLFDYKLVKQEGLISGKYHFYSHELVYGKINPQLGKVAFPQFEGLCSADAYAIHTVNNKLTIKYLYYYMLSKPFITATILESLRMGMPKINSEDLMKLNVLLPDVDEQKRIVDYLDKKCAKVDSVIDQTRASIEEYKKLKQAVITQAVTKGIRPGRKMKDSGIEWIGEIPADWNLYRIAHLYDERKEEGLEELPILTVSINTGISDHEVADEEKERVFVRSEDRTKYKRVYPGDLAYNMMRAWQGAFGAVRVDGMISPAYVVVKPKEDKLIDSRYMEALLRTPSAIEEMHRYSHGITDFRLRLYWPEFKNIRICLPAISEQKEIADYLDVKKLQIDELIQKKEKLLTYLESYKKSLIFEYVTGKKEVV